MDEAGIPEESRESLKVLHKVLDNPEVSFVAITNHLLDASKTNRALSLFRSQYVQEDLNELMKECLPNIPEAANHLCEAYFKLMKDDYFQEFFGLRDFIHLGHYLKRNAAMNMLDPQCLMEAIERNFNGYQDYENVCQQFLQANNYFPEDVTRRSVVSVLKSSLEVESAKIDLTNEAQKVRYKLVIDSSEDESVTRLLYAFNIVDPATTRTYMCSSFPEDGAVQEINTIAAIRHAIRKGFTIVMTQTGSIHGSFYDVFNQYFKIIEDPEKGATKFYANIAIGSNLKQCQVHRDFQCVVVIKRSELPMTPGAFLNRFEKYSLSHNDFLDARLSEIPQNLKAVLIATKSKVEEFMNFFGTSSFYGAVDGETVNSLVLSVLPRCGFVPNLAEDVASLDVGCSQFQAVEYILNVLRMKAGLRFTLASFSKETAWTINPGDGTGEAFLSGRYSRLEIITHVNNAMKYLLSDDPNSIHITIEEQFVISVIGQWLVFYLCRRLLNLMTAEGFIFGHMKMPAWCVDSYLVDQNHFSLKMIIDSHFHRLYEKDPHHLEPFSNKVVCFTRSSPELHGLPAFNSATSKIDDPVFADVKKIIYDNLEKVHLCKMSSIMSEKVFEDQLELFFDNSNSDIMVLVTDMQETSASIVNHARIMVEEMENSKHLKKLFIFLLHFPSSLYHEPCYPAIFAPGWDHCYLDTVQPRVLDIRQWFITAYQGESENVRLFHKEMLNDLEEDAVRVVSSRVMIGSTNGGNFNSVCGSEEKFKRFHELLFGPVGTKLVDMYMQCWKKADLVLCLKEAAEHTRTTKSPLSITEVVQDHFRSTFFNFLSFVIHNINTDLNIDLVLGIDPESETMKLFLSILSVWPLPKLAEIKAYNNTFDSRQMESVKPSFPFFWKVCSVLDHLVDESIEEYRKERPLNWTSPTSHTFVAKKDEIIKCSTTKLTESSNQVLGLALSAVQQHPQLWQDYKKHFLSSKCHINDIKHPNVVEVLESHFGKVFAITDVTKCLATMHYQAHVEPLDLGPFTHMQIDHVLSGGKRDTEGEGAIMSVFNVFSRDALSDERVEIIDRIKVLKSWQSVMLEKMASPIFKQWIYTRATKPDHQSKMHTMAAIFFLMQSWDKETCNDTNYKFILAVRHPLIQQIVTEGNYIGLKEVMENILRVLQQFSTKGATDQPLTISMSHFLQAIIPYFINAWRPWDNFTLRNIKWFLEEINKFADNGTLRTLSHFSNEVEKDSLLWNLQVHILGDLLTCQLKSGHNWSNPLGVFSIYARQKVGAMLCARASSPFSYFPVVYRERFQSYTDQNLGDAIVQPLADAYFLCLMEHWGSLQEQNPSTLLKLITKTQKKLVGCEDASEKSLLQIEHQAVLQVVLNAFTSDVISNHLGLKTMVPDVRSIHPIIIGSAPNCHKKMMMIYLLRHLKSTVTLDQFLESQVAAAISDVLDQEVHVPGHIPMTCPRLDCFSFMSNHAADKDLLREYQLISKHMCATECDKSLKKLESKLQRTLRDENPFCGSNGLKIDRKLFLKMCVWLVVYHEFFRKQKKSPLLADAVRKRLSLLDFTPEQLCILNCFLTSDLIKAEEDVNECGSPMPNSAVDPLYNLFMCTDMGVETEDSALCNMIANMVGVGFSLPCKVTHLWTFLFEPAALTGTCLPGFLGNKPASDQPWISSRSGLDEVGDFYESEHGSTLGLSLHSLRFMLLLNFGALSVSMLTIPKAQSAIHGGVISESVHVRNFCLKNLRRLWNQVLSCVNGDTSRRQFLATQCLQQLLHVVHTEKRHLDSVFPESVQVLKYEKFWHCNIHEETKLKLELKYDEHCPQVKNEYFATLRDLERQCNEFPALNRMKHDLIEHIGIKSSGPQVLLKFVNVFHQLSVGSALLPELVKFYNWLNTHLSHLLTYQSARDSTVGQVVLLASKRYSEGESAVKNYDKMRVQFNKFVDLCGGFLWHHDECIEKLDGNTKIERLLTTANGNDWLCHTIDCIVDLHNSLLDLTRNSQNKFLLQWLPAKEVSCNVTLFRQSMAIVWQAEELEQKLTRLFHSKSSFHGFGELRTKSAYHWDELECAVVREYIIGKPKLLDTNKGLKKPFRFRTVPMEDVTCGIYGVTSPGRPMDLAAVRQELPNDYTDSSSLSEEDKKTLESVFHKLDYHSLVGLVLTLRNVAAKLKEELLTDGVTHYDELKVLFKDEEPLAAIGTVRLQESVLMKFKVTQLYQILAMFVEWINSCYYAFNEVSYTLKKRLPRNLQEHFRNGLGSFAETQPEQLNLVSVLENVLSNFIAKGASYLIQGPSLGSRLDEYVEMYSLCEQKVVKIIPRIIQLQHIVHFIIFLRREKNALESHSLIVPLPQVDVWQDRLVLPLSDAQSFSSTFAFSRSHPQALRTHSPSLSEVTIWTDHKIPSILHLNSQDTLVEWSVDQVTAWLENIKLEEHVECFQENRVNGKVLLQCDHECLENFGVVSKPDRIKILTRMNEVDSSHEMPSSGCVSEWTVEEVIDWLEDVKLEGYAEIVKDRDVTGEELLQYDHECLEEIGVISKPDRIKIITKLKAMNSGKDLQPSSPEHVSGWTAGQVIEWLKMIKMGEHIKLFQQKEVDGAELVQYDSKCLIGIGVKKKNDQSKIISELNKLLK
jgi:hypothetical protein